MRVSIAVGGKFHADYMANSFLAAEHTVQLYSTLPYFRFPRVPSSIVTSTIFPEISYRLLRLIGKTTLGENIKMTHFGKAVAGRILHESPDLAVIWSSYAKETFESSFRGRKVLVRDSAHIEYQMEILKEEYKRVGLDFNSKHVVVERECKEYELADRILVLSRFAEKSFTNKGVPPTKICVNPLGVDTSIFKPKLHFNCVLPLKVVYFGALSIQKGVHYLLEATKDISPSAIELNLIGPVEREFRPILGKYSHAKVFSTMPHPTLASFLERMDVLVFPTLHDGFGQVVIQAMASGIVPIVTDHCGASDLVSHSKNGWIVPAGHVQSLRDAILNLVEIPERLPLMALECQSIRKKFHWNDYSKKILKILESIDRSHASVHSRHHY